MAGSSDDTRADRVNKIIKEVYYDSGALGSIKRTLADAREKDPDLKIKESEVKTWKDQNIQRKINLRGFNSFIASSPQEEYQMDLFEMPVPRYKDARKMTAAERKAHQKKIDEARNARRRVKREPGEGVRRGVKPKTIVVDKPPKNAPKRYGLLLVDIFTKYVDVVPMLDNQAPTVIDSLKNSSANMWG